MRKFISLKNLITNKFLGRLYCSDSVTREIRKLGIRMKGVSQNKKLIAGSVVHGHGVRELGGRDGDDDPVHSRAGAPLQLAHHRGAAGHHHHGRLLR